MEFHVNVFTEASQQLNGKCYGREIVNYVGP